MSETSVETSILDVARWSGFPARVSLTVGFLRLPALTTYRLA